MQASTPKPVVTTSKASIPARNIALQGIAKAGQLEYPKKDSGSRPNTKGMEPKLTHNKDDHSA